ncbi:alpha/beta fold hydrolase [Natronorarus salvus]|uniref:alpha/beta fold hydrolase n=1 Tax=Natronorarus salvus TaxID=3117733 RepID=UPI002F26CFED
MDERPVGDRPIEGPWHHDETIVNGVRLHYVEAGEGPLVLCLHGFPEFWYAWREQIPALAEAGYHVVAPDLRGYNRSEKPTSLASYRIGELVRDCVELIGTFDDQAHVVAHDWGGTVAWELAARHPEVVDRLAILNAPHPRAFERELRTADQLGRSWYTFFFQLPVLPELGFRVGGYRVVESAVQGSALPGAFSNRDRERYEAALARPGALSAAIHYYRAAGRGVVRELPKRVIPGREPDPEWVSTGGEVSTETLVIWGMNDVALSPRLTEGLEEWVANLRVERFEEATHWVQADRPAEVNDLLLDFFDGPEREPSGSHVEAPGRPLPGGTNDEPKGEW